MFATEMEELPTDTTIDIRIFKGVPDDFGT